MAIRIRGDRVAVGHRHAERAELADHLTEGGVLAARDGDVVDGEIG